MEDKLFGDALQGMGDMYASALGTTVVRHRAIPARSSSLDGELVVLGFEPVTGHNAAEPALRLALEAHGTLDSLHIDTQGRWRARFASHAAAERAAAAGIAGAAAAFTSYNSRSYEERGWTTFESAVSTYAVVRASYYPRLQSSLSPLPPKLIDIGGSSMSIVAQHSDVDLPTQIDHQRARIQAATFTGKGDKEVVIDLYNRYITAIGNAINDSGENMEGAYEGEYNALWQRDGHGKMRYPAGETYEGHWKAGEKHGHGKYYHANGNIYEGEWQHGQKTGFGKFYLANGCVYEGDFRADTFDGRGKYQWANGNVYVGQFKNSLRVGPGTLRFASGVVTMDNYNADGVETGEGVAWSADGQKAMRRWNGDDGEAISLEEARQIGERLSLPVTKPLTA